MGLRASLAGLLAVCLLASSAAAWPASGDTSPEARMWAWAKTFGAKQKGFSIGRACPECMRGVVASKDIKRGATIIKVPFTAVLRLKDPTETTFAAGYARELLNTMHNDPSFNETWALFWSTQPGPEDVFTPEVWTDAHLAMLQVQELEYVARYQRDLTDGLYDGGHVHYPALGPFTDVVPADRLTKRVFKAVASLLGSRYFSFYRDGSTDKTANHLVPFIDLINHSDEPNAARSDDGTFVLVKATQDIKKGEEITNNYQPGVVHRPDMSLYIYGFVVPRETPYLAAVDLPSFDPSNPFGATATDDSAYEAGGALSTAAEFERLLARLGSLPTTEAEDQAALDEETDWRLRAMLEFRVLRKRALRQTLAKLSAALGIPYDGTPERPAPLKAAVNAAKAVEAPAPVTTQEPVTVQAPAPVEEEARDEL